MLCGLAFSVADRLISLALAESRPGLIRSSSVVEAEEVLLSNSENDCCLPEPKAAGFVGGGGFVPLADLDVAASSDLVTPSDPCEVAICR